MNFLLTPVLMVGLLMSPAVPAGEGTQAAPQCGSHCAVRAEAPDDPAALELQRHARKHSEYYRVLVRAQKSAAEQRTGRQFTAHSQVLSPSENKQ